MTDKEPHKQGFQHKFTENDFLNVMKVNTPMTQNSISKRMKCVNETAGTYLKKLEEQGKVRRIEVIGGRDVNWERVE
jgi:DNA-binding Lrp family transcriptional regulator